MEIQTESALQMFARFRDTRICLCTGHLPLDDLFGNTLPVRAVTEIVGEAGIGKVELAMTIVARMLICAEKFAWAAVILDYNGTFRTDRLLRIIRKIANQKNDDMGMQLLKRVYFERVYSYEHLQSSFTRLISQFTSSNLIPLIVVNEVGAILSDTSFMEQEGSMEQDRILRLMREFCMTSGGVVLTINHVVHWRGFPSPALGNTWIGGIANRIFLNYDETNGRLFATIQGRFANKEENLISYTIQDSLFAEE